MRAGRARKGMVKRRDTKRKKKAGNERGRIGNK